MKVKKGNKVINGGKTKSIADIECRDKYEIYVFRGKLTPNDIIIKYSENKKRIRTPKHIHWTVDILMKLQGNSSLTKEFLYNVKAEWTKCKQLKSGDLTEISTIISKGEKKFNIKSFEKLNDYGEYDIDFLFTLMQLLMIQEKTNRPDAYMFASIIEKLLEENLDIFSIMSTAGFGGRR